MGKRRATHPNRQVKRAPPAPVRILTVSNLTNIAEKRTLKLSITTVHVRRANEAELLLRRNDDAIHDHGERQQRYGSREDAEEKLIAAMATFHEELARAGVLLDASGLQPTSKGARIRYSGGKRTVIDGPFTESKELIAGYTLDSGEVARTRNGMGQALPCSLRRRS